jgi:hypothetical protein
LISPFCSRGKARVEAKDMGGAVSAPSIKKRKKGDTTSSKMLGNVNDRTSESKAKNRQWPNK